MNSRIAPELQGRPSRAGLAQVSAQAIVATLLISLFGQVGEAIAQPAKESTIIVRPRSWLDPGAPVRPATNPGASQNYLFDAASGSSTPVNEDVGAAVNLPDRFQSQGGFFVLGFD
jgi:hypothetical protein